MNCIHHYNQVATTKCSRCGQPICNQCANLFEPPVCLHCAGNYADEVKSKMLRNIALSIVLSVAGLIFFDNFLAGVVLLGFPYGWSFASGIIGKNLTFASLFTNNFMLVILVIFFRLFVAFCIGMVVTPIQIIRWVKDLNKANALLKSVSHHQKQ